MSYVNTDMTLYRANPLKQRFNVNFDGKKPVGKKDEEGKFLALNCLVIAQNTEQSATADGPQHGSIPQKRNIVALVNTETGEVLPQPFKEYKSVSDDDVVTRTLRPAEGGGQLARITDVREIVKMDEAVEHCLAELD